MEAELAAKTTFRLVAGVARTLAAATAVIGMGLLGSSGPASSQTVTPGSTDQVQHFLDCFGVMISDPDAHAANCSPGHEWTGPFQNATNYEAGQPTSPPVSCPPTEDDVVELDGDSGGDGCPLDSVGDLTSDED
jgi:hypothetical protein